jgi:hypothetical protein
MFLGCEKNTGGKKETKFEIDKDYQQGPVTVHERVDKAKITIADTFLLEFETAVGPGYEVRMPKVDKVLENFGIVNTENLGNKLDENNNVVSRYRYKLEPFLSGTFQIPAFKFEFYDVNSPDDKKYEITTEPVDIEVASLLGEQDGVRHEEGAEAGLRARQGNKEETGIEEPEATPDERPPLVGDRAEDAVDEVAGEAVEYREHHEGAVDWKIGVPVDEAEEGSKECDKQRVKTVRQACPIKTRAGAAGDIAGDHKVVIRIVRDKFSNEG